MKHAFAFRDFDGEKILSRPYFKRLDFAAGRTDTEILQSLKAAADDSVDDMENKLIIIKGICYRVIQFQNFISRHMKRLGSLNLEKAKSTGVKLSELKGNALMLEYMATIPVLNIFLDEWKKNYYELEKQIQERYRREFAARLKKARTAAGLTQRQLADMIQISPTGFASYEQAKSDPSIPTLIRLAKILKLSENQILGLT